MENHNYCIFPFDYFRLDARKPHVFVYFSPLFTSLSEIHYGNESFCIREPLIPISHNLFWFFPRQQISFPEGWFGFSKDIFEGRNQKICDVEKGLLNGRPSTLKTEYIKLDRDKSTFKSHRDFDSEIEMTFKHF